MHVGNLYDENMYMHNAPQLMLELIPQPGVLSSYLTHC